jgi:hypothetical protein
LLTNLRHRLLEVLLADDGRAVLAARLISQTGSWTEAIALSKSWKVIPRLHDRIRAMRLKVPASDAGTIKAEYLRTYERSAFRALKAIGAMRALEAAGIPVVAFKGLASMGILYGDSKHRAIQDADILILRKNLSHALACLQQAGFERQGPETLSQYLRFVEDSPGFAGNQAVTVYGEQACEIDVHWELAGSGLRPEQILGRATKCQLMGSTIPVVDAKDGFLLTIHHALRENLAIESICRDLLDAQLWLRHLREDGRLEEGIEWAAQSRCKVAALALVSLLHGCNGATEASDAARLLCERATPRERRSATSLRELFDFQLSHGRIAKDVFYLVHSRPWRQVLKGLVTDWSGYRRSMQAMEERLGENGQLDHRAARLVKSIPGLHELRLARELACIKFGAN